MYLFIRSAVCISDKTPSYTRAPDGIVPRLNIATLDLHRSVPDRAGAGALPLGRWTVAHGVREMYNMCLSLSLYVYLMYICMYLDMYHLNTSMRAPVPSRPPPGGPEGGAAEPGRLGARPTARPCRGKLFTFVFTMF